MKETKIILPEVKSESDKSSPFEKTLRNNYLQIQNWAISTSTDCFRLYDRELPEFPLIIDYYAGRFCIQYISTSRDQLEPSTELISQTNRVLQWLFFAKPEFIYWRIRSKSKETRQYEKLGESKQFFIAHENGIKFYINLVDYLDTGLFLDHRNTRQMVAKSSIGKSLLNLFAYTCSFSIHAAQLGSTFTKSVDLSNTYTNWGRENFLLNNISLKNNPIVRGDCLIFLDEEMRSGKKYDVIVIDPPTISRSKKMKQMFDVQKDYISLITKSISLLNRSGTIFFSTNSRKFKFDERLFPMCKIEEITNATIPQDFSDKKIHRCWVLKLV